MKNDLLGDRMKKNYENRAKSYLIRRMPVIIRIDGRAFHTFTKGFRKPYDIILMRTMQKTMMKLCENIQGCKFGYTQSDEITLLLIDYDNLDTEAWFDYNIEKICSISASMTTLYFNQILAETLKEGIARYNLFNEFKLPYELEERIKYMQTIENAIKKGAMFDSRCFNIPREEVTNCFIWRQQDATRNAIQLLGQSNFSHKELQKKSCNEIQDMLFTEKKINFNDEPTDFKRGSCTYRIVIQNPMVDIKDGAAIKNVWKLDLETPIFSQDRNFIKKLIY